MLSSRPYEPHTPSGRGATIADRSFLDFSDHELRTLIDTFQWLVFKHHPLSGSDVAEHLGNFGRLVENDRRQNGILSLDGSKKEEVLLGEGYMPLHRDGAFMGNDIALVGIYCVEYQNVTGGGRTFISDIASAVKEVPATMLDFIRAKGIQGKPVDSYYTKPSDTWLPIPGFVDVGDASSSTSISLRTGREAELARPYPGHRQRAVPDDHRDAIRRTHQREVLLLPPLERRRTLASGQSSDAPRTRGLSRPAVAREHPGHRRRLEVTVVSSSASPPASTSTWTGLTTDQYLHVVGVEVPQAEVRPT